MAASLARNVALLLACALLLAACEQVPESLAVEGTPPPPPPTKPVEEEPLEASLEWEECGEPFECATLAVPVDHDALEGTTLDLSVIRLPAPAAADRLGSLVVNPGGPGGSGVEYVRHAAISSIPAELRARFDIVGFDPRGIGQSEAIRCGSDPLQRFGDSLSADAGGVEAVLSAAEALAGACADAGGELLAHMSTSDVIADLDLLRAAVGDRKLTYLGYSYGTLIGAMYAERFPENVRALVLDGAVDPSLDVAARARDKAATLEHALDDFLGWCADARQCALSQLDTPPRDVYDGVLATLDAAPLPALDGTGRVTRGTALYTVAALLPDRQYGWPLLGAALASAHGGDGGYFTLLFDAMTGEVDADADAATFDMSGLLAVNCLDVPAPSPEHYPSLLAEVESVSPLLGPLALLSWAPCSYWSIPAMREAGPIAAPDSPPLMVIGTVNDAVTPYVWSEALAEQLGSARLFTRDGDGHTAFGGDNVCTDRAVIRYLLDGVMPAEGTACG